MAAYVTAYVEVSLGQFSDEDIAAEAIARGIGDRSQVGGAAKMPRILLGIDPELLQDAADELIRGHRTECIHRLARALGYPFLDLRALL
jgi:hypothetical protein